MSDPPTTPLIFSGHETFALRSTWLKKAVDLLMETPTLFFQDGAFVRLGVGKNMAKSIRYWGQVCGIFDRVPNESRHVITDLGKKLFSDDGLDPFLTTPAASWLLHWQIAAHAEAAFTWYYTFNLFTGGEWVGLKERHPDLFEKAKRYESENGSESFYWRQRESLARLERPERMAQIKREHCKRLEEERRRRPGRPLIELVGAALDAEDDDRGCDICHL